MIKLNLMRAAACAVFFIFAGGSRGQGTKEDYARADGLGKATSGKVFRDRVEPNWINGTSRFWYRVQTGKLQHRFVIVDPDEATRSDAFDHARMAEALSASLNEEVNPASLPMREIDFSEDGLVLSFVAEGKGFRLDLENGTLSAEAAKESENGTTVNVLPAPRSARAAGESTEISFVNKTSGTVLLFWVSNPDNPTAYGSVDAGEEHDQHTYAGHVWLVTDEKKKPLSVYEAVARPGVAVVDGSWKPGANRTANERRGRRGRGQRNRSGASSASPDGKWRAEIREHNVVITDTDTNAAHVLSSEGTSGDPFQERYYWSPDSKRLVAIQEKQEERRVVHVVESSPKEQLQPELKSFDYVKPGDPLNRPRPRMFDVEKKVQLSVDESLFSNPYRLSEFRWEPDSSRFSFLYNKRGHEVLRLVGINAESGECSSVIEETPDTFVCYSSKTLFRPIEKSSEIIWMSERDGWNHLYLFDLKSGKLKNQITSGDWVVRSVDRIDEEERQVWFQAGGLYPGEDPYHVHYCRIDFDGKNLVRLTEGDGTHRIRYSPDSKYLIDTYSRVDLPPVTELRRVSDGLLVTRLETADVSELVSSGWQQPDRFVAKGRDGKTDIYGVVLKPSNFDPKKRYPVVEHIYAGPHSAHVPKRFAGSHGGQAIAELGFIVVRIDGMGTSNRSKAFHDVCWQNIGDAGFPDRVKWIKAAAASRPWMDLSRVGIYGGSAGGQNAMRALIAHHDFYHVAVADCGCHDNRMDKIWWNEQWMGYPIGDHYSESSNVDQAHRLQGKLMLIVGELDRNVDPASTMQVADALIKADKDFDLVVVPGAGHGAAGTPYGRRRQRDFLVRNLLGVEPRN